MTTTRKTNLTFATDTAPISSISYRDAQNLFHAGHHPVNPIMRDDGLFQYERGAAALGLTPNGTMLLVSTTDVDDLKLEHRFSNVKGDLISVDADDIGDMADDFVVNEKLPGSKHYTYLGQFIQEQNYKNGDTNYKHILGIAAWKPTPKELVYSVLHDFSNYHRQDLLDSGILMRHDKLLWTSKEIVLAAKPSTKKNSIGKTISRRDSEGNELYDLEVLIAPGKGGDAAHLYHSNFSEKSKKLGGPIAQSFMRNALESVMEHKKNMTIAEIEAYAQDFSRSAKLLRQGKSTYTHDDKGEQLEGPALLKGRLKKAFTSAVFGLGRISRIDIATGVLAPAAMAIFGLMTEQEKLSLTVAAIPISGLVLARFGSLLFTRSRPNFGKKFNDLVHNFWAEGIKNNKNMPKQFEMIHERELRNLRILPSSEMYLFTKMPANEVVNTPRWEDLYVVGTQNGPYGSQSRFHKIGEQWVIRVDEDKDNSGMSIEYWIQSDISFSMNASSDHLPQKLINTARAHEGEINMVRAIKNKRGGITGYESTFIDQAKYEELTAALANNKVRELYKAPVQDLKFCINYKFNEANEEKEPEEEESEWAQDSEAATFAEAVVESVKAVTHGMHI